jgi:acyl-CoA-binding protein
MTLADDFEAAQANVKKLSRTPAADELLELYALYKQATQGDVTGAQPGVLDFKGRAKYDAWAARRGVDRESAMRSYVTLAERLAQKYR